MSPSAPAATAGQGSARVASVDLLRGADVLLMLFVNEVAGVVGAPAFLLHKPSDVDGMTITDLVFPAFLVIVGIVIPFSLGGRLRRGETRGEVWRHVLKRTLALLVMGVFMVNGEQGVSGLLSEPAWTVVGTLGILLVWGAPESGWGRVRRSWLRWAGLALLLFVALVYRNPGLTGWVQLRPYWWGILGLIGWAYLGVATLYLLAGDRPAILVGAMGLCYCVALAEAAGSMTWLKALSPAVGPIVGTHGAQVLAGALLGVLLRRHLQDRASAWGLAARILGCAAALGAAAILLRSLNGVHPAFIISKNHATAPWGLASSALTLGAWVAIFVVVDVLAHRRWPRSFMIAGENPLVAYLMAPFLTSLFALSAALFGGVDFYAALGRASTGVGLVRSAVFAWVVVRLSGWMRSRGVVIQL